MSLMPPRFVLFGPGHLGALAVTAVLAAGLTVVVRRDREGSLSRAIRRALALALLAATAATLGQWARLGLLSFWDLLPLHLCDFLIVVAVFALLSRRQTPYELLYFWGLTGTLLALAGPDLRTDFPDWRFLSFFALHGLVVIAGIVLTLGFGLRPAAGAPLRVFLWTNAYAAVVGLVNAIFDQNFLYLCRKPGAGTLLDWLGPWPVYIVAVDILGLALFFLLDLPFARSRRSGPMPADAPLARPAPHG